MTYTYEGSARSARDFRGVIDAVMAVRDNNGLGYEAYEANWNGVIAAILSLNDITLTPIGEVPPGWEILPDDEEGNPGGGIQGEIKNGQLWFDERQGRLFIWDGTGWFQTNGADGLTAVQENPPQGPPLGSFWYNTGDDNLYIWNGSSWLLVNGGGAFYDTGTLTLTNPVNDGFKNLKAKAKILPKPENLLYQADANHYFVECFTQLDAIVDELQEPQPNSIEISDAPPDEPYEGMLWFDSTSVDLLVYYDDGNTKQWVPTSTTHIIDDKVQEVEQLVLHEITARERAINQVKQAEEFGRRALTAKLEAVENKQIVLRNDFDAYTDPDLSAYEKTVDVDQKVAGVLDVIDGVRSEIPDVSPFATQDDLTHTTAGVQTLLNEYATLQNLTEIQNEIPDVSEFVKQSDIETAVNAVKRGYLKENGGVLNGSLTLRNPRADAATLDFSTLPAHSKYAFEFASNGPNNPKASFGTNNEFWEYAWQFYDQEDFCWKHGSNKVVSIAKDGLVARKLMIGQFQPNAITGRNVMNTIDVGQEILSLKAEVASLKSKLNNHNHGV